MWLSVSECLEELCIIMSFYFRKLTHAVTTSKQKIKICLSAHLRFDGTGGQAEFMWRIGVIPRIRFFFFFFFFFFLLYQ